MNIIDRPGAPRSPSIAGQTENDVIHLTCDCLQEPTYSISLCGRMEPKDKTRDRLGLGEDPLDRICVECESLIQIHVCYEDDDDFYEDLGDA